MKIKIKPIEGSEEISGKAFVHWKSWHESYDGLLSDTYQESITLERCQKREKSSQDKTLVAIDEDKVVGFVTYGKSREDLPNVGEIYALYVLADYQGHKIGYQLMNAAIKKLQGVSKIILWVLAENSRSVNFYQRYGFKYDGQENLLNLGNPVLAKCMVLEIE